MLNDEDINKLTSVLASKTDIKEIQNELADLKELVQGLLVSTDGIAKPLVT